MYERWRSDGVQWFAEGPMLEGMGSRIISVFVSKALSFHYIKLPSSMLPSNFIMILYTYVNINHFYQMSNFIFQCFSHFSF